MNDQGAALIPMYCPRCGRYVAASAWCEIRVETAAGTLAIGANYARFLCVCGAVSETRRTEYGRLHLVPWRPRQPQSWGRRRR